MPSTNWQEKIDPGEAERFEKYAQQFREMQQKNARGGALPRALHAKGQIALEAQLQVLPDLPEHARAGIFSRPATFRAWARFSNGAGAHQHDGKPDVRGVALKLVGVPGKKLIPGMEDAQTQDFLLIRSSSTPFRTADEFVPVVMAATFPLRLPKAIAAVGFFRLLKILGKLQKGLSEPMNSFAATHYYSATPFRLGAHAVRYGLRPALQAAGPGPVSRDYLGEELAARVRTQPVEYDFQLQFFEDEKTTPIEDASVDWTSPWLTVARLTIPAQDVSSERGKRVAELAEGFSFDPWHALVEMRPLGNVNRARNAAYRVSTQARKASKEPDGSEL